MMGIACAYCGTQYLSVPEGVSPSCVNCGAPLQASPSQVNMDADELRCDNRVIVRRYGTLSAEDVGERLNYIMRLIGSDHRRGGLT